MRRFTALLLAATMALTISGCGLNKVDDKATTGVAEKTTTGESSGDNVSGSSVSGKESDVLKEAFANDFSFGVSVVMGELNNTGVMKHVKNEFNSLTMGNELKPDSLLDWQASQSSSDGMPEINEARLDDILTKVEKYDIPLRGHTLVWHSQTPDWFFAKDYEPSEGTVDKDTMRNRMEAYIKKVLTYCKEKHPGTIYAWDVVNECVSDDGEYRQDSQWYNIFGDESYVLDAFRFARKYAGDDVKLFLNDYNEYMPIKRDKIIELIKKLKEENLIDGFGMQSHWDMDNPGSLDLETTLEEYGAIEGLELHLTEIDMHNTDDSNDGLEKQAERYKRLFEIITKADREGKANITNVTFWGIVDENSWLSGFKGETSYPLLFDGNFEKKPCYDAILSVANSK